MNILFYVEPVIEREKPYWKKEWVNNICFDIVTTLKKAQNDYHFELMTNEAIEQIIEFEDKDIRIHTFTQEELLKPFGTNYMNVSKSWHLNSYTKKQLSYYEKLMSEKLNGFIPDIIITFSPVPFFKSIFKNALIFHHEFSIFSRLPYPNSWFLDPIGVSSHSFYNSFSKEIEKTLLNKEEEKQLEDFKLLCKNIFIEKSPFQTILEDERKKFSSIVLLPLQFSGYYLFDDLVPFKSQYEYCVYVLDNIDKSIGVVVNMHPEYPILDNEAIKFLKSKYPNFICKDEFNTIYASGQFILPFVDAVVSVSSSVALQALLFDKKVILLGDSCFDYIADANSLDEIKTTLASKEKNKDNILYHIITRYAITSKYLHNPIWLENFLTSALTSFRKNGIDVNFYNLIDEEHDLFEHLSSTISQNSHSIPQYVKGDKIQLFFDFGKGIDDKNILTQIVSNEKKQTFIFDLSHITSFTSLRLDPLDKYCVIDLKSFILISENDEKDISKEVYSNAYNFDNNKYFFESNDPQIFFIPENKQTINNIKKIIITINYECKGEEALLYTLENSKNITNKQKNKIITIENEKASLQNEKSHLENEKASLQNEKSHLENEYLLMLNSRSMRITAPLREIASIIKRYIKMTKIDILKNKMKNSMFDAKTRKKLKKIEILSKQYIQPTMPWLHSFIFEKLKRYVKRAIIKKLVPIEKIEGVDFSNLFKDEEFENSGKKPLVTIIVPNYNHEPYLKERLDSIYAQSYTNFEVILLDDVSSDNSVNILEKYRKKYSDKTHLIVNEKNSGGVFHQWKKGIECAKGELIWIAESDDFCSLDLLEKLVPFFENDGVMLAYAKTIFIQDGKEIWTINEYLNDIDTEIWKKEFLSCSHTLVNQAWGIKNILPNASSAIFRNPKGLGLLDDTTWQKMRICGDWVFYLHMIRGGLVGYTPNATNYYRLHNSNTSVATYAKEIYYKEHEYVAQTLCKLYNIDEKVLEKQKISLKGHWNNYMVDKSESDFLKLYDIEKIKKSINDRKPNIMMVTFAFAAGGGETLPIKMANMLSNVGYGVTMVSFQQDEENPATRAMLLPYIPAIKIYNPEKIEAIATGLGIEVIHSHHAWVDLTLAALLEENNKIAMVISTHGMYEMMSEDEFKDNFDILKRRVDKIVYTAKKNLAPFLNMNETDNLMVKIGNALEPCEINPIKREDLGIDKDAFVLCLVSRAIPQKGWEEAIKSIKKAREISNKNIELILIGEGEEYTRLKEIENQKFIHFCGFKSNIRDYFAMSNLGFLPSRFEGESFPLVIIDSLYANKPVLSSNIGEIYDMLHENNECAGAVFDLIDMQIPIEDVANLIAKFATDEEFYQKSLNAIEKVILKYNPKKMIEKYDSIYSEICKKRVK